MQPQYGCECSTCAKHQDKNPLTAPVAYRIRRNGKEMNVCTLCINPEDVVLGLLVDAHTPVSDFVDYDAFGFMGVVEEILKQTDEPKN